MIMKKTKTNEKKVVVGVSGGVDSSVTLHLLKEKGYDPVGVFMKFWGENNHCCGSEAERRARKVCSSLRVPFYVVDVRESFKKRVVDYFLESYKEGETPNPCIACNKEIKFNFLFEKLKALDGCYVATGHYGRINKGKIFEAVDEVKDQTYFLWSLEGRSLKRIILPLGELEKSHVRKIAKELGLVTASTEESQEVCFVENNLKDFLEEYIDLIPGKIESVNGVEMGTHFGLPAYTIGQRKGIGLSGGPFYVLKKDAERNVLVVTDKKDDLLEKVVYFEKENFFEDLKYPMDLEAKIRYNARREKGALVSKGVFEFKKPQESVTPGQSIVFYHKDQLVGGGIIK